MIKGRLTKQQAETLVKAYCVSKKIGYSSIMWTTHTTEHGYLSSDINETYEISVLYTEGECLGDIHIYSFDFLRQIAIEDWGRYEELLFAAMLTELHPTVNHGRNRFIHNASLDIRVKALLELLMEQDSLS